MMGKSIIFIALILCLSQACGPGKENPVFPGSDIPDGYQYAIEYVGIGIYSIEGSLLNSRYFKEGIFRKEDPFNNRTPGDSLFTFYQDSLNSISLNFRADTYPFDLDSLQVKKWEEKKEKISWQWRFWHLKESSPPAPYARLREWELIGGKFLFPSDDLEGKEDDLEGNKKEIRVMFPCPQYFEPFAADDTLSIWRIEALMFDANLDSLGLPDQYKLDIEGGYIKGFPIRVTCGG
ncbi:MAG: hypothetical protein HOC20_05115 [Chloroflexi bacterium]|jgi:hypothetical protein|nr:hypothetical protein [Chloroflexota bacterium]